MTNRPFTRGLVKISHVAPPPKKMCWKVQNCECKSAIEWFVAIVLITTDLGHSCRTKPARQYISDHVISAHNVPIT